MTSLRKHIVPFQRNDLKLAFNIQSHDTIKYDAKNISAEIDRAVKDAIRMTESKESYEKKLTFSDKAILRRLELSGFESKDDNWFLNNVIEDTDFKGFGHDEKRFYLLLAKIDEFNEFQDHLDDLGVIIYRIEKRVDELTEKLSATERRQAFYVKRAEEVSAPSAVAGRVHTLSGGDVRSREVDRMQVEINDIRSKMELLGTMYIGFIINPQLPIGDFQQKAESLISQHDHYKLSLSKDKAIQFGKISVSLLQEEF